jgi:hypothetical protein
MHQGAMQPKQQRTNRKIDLHWLRRFLQRWHSYLRLEAMRQLRRVFHRGAPGRRSDEIVSERAVAPKEMQVEQQDRMVTLQVLVF